MFTSAGRKLKNQYRKDGPMKFYLSSNRLGNQTELLKSLIPQKKIGYIPNALDFSNPDLKKIKSHIVRDMDDLKEIGLTVDFINLQEYFNKQEELKKILDKLGAIFISGGNTFILRQAMKLSGLDLILKEKWDQQDSFLYAGYSAAGCVLSPSLTPYQIVDDPSETPYQDIKETLWEGLNFIDFAFMPHFNSDHEESDGIKREIEYCKKNNLPYKTLVDGEVIIIK